MASLEQGELDFALVTNVEQVPGYRFLPVEMTSLQLAVREGDPLLECAESREGYSYPVIPRERMEGLKMVSLPATTNSGNLIRELFKKYSINPRIVLEVSDVRSMMDAVECGLGAAMFLSVPAGKRAIRYLCIEGIEPVEQMASLAFKADKNLSEAMRYLIRLITGGS